MSGHIRLGATAETLRDYALMDPRQGVQQSANPFAANISTNNPYGSLSTFSEWVQSNWEEGVGKKDPEAEGMLYAHLDSRFPSQLILPLGFEYPYTSIHPNGGAAYAAGDLTVAVGERRSASFRTSSASYSVSSVWVFVDGVDGTTITVELFGDSGNLPTGAALCSGSATLDKQRPGPLWLRVDVSNTTLSTNTRYHVAVSADATLTLPAYTPTSGEFGANYTSGAWSGASNTFGYLSSFVRANNNLGLQDGSGSLLQQTGDEFLIISHGDRLGWIVRCKRRLFAAYNNQLLELSGSSVTSVTDTGNAAISDVLAVDDVVYVAYGAGHKTYNVSTNTVTDVSSVDADLFALFNGYLWRATGSDLYYTADGTTWSAAIPIGYGDAPTGLAGMAGVMYVATTSGLYQIGDGDVALQITAWPTTDERNGVGMVEWDGSLYIPLAEDILRYDGANIMQVGLRTGEELPGDIQGDVFRLQPTKYFLLASMAPSSQDGFGSLWAWNNHGWHGLGLLPQGVRGGAIYLDTEAGYLYWGGSYGLIARAIYPSNVVNPIRDRGTHLFNRTGWIEYDRFYGGYVALDKDFESVYVDTETNATRLSLYWQDQDSTDWELLGSSTDEDFEKRWSDYTTRPNSKWLRLALLARTDDGTQTPIIRAHRLKFHTMLTDRWRWQVAIDVHNRQQLPDGMVNEYDTAEMLTHLDGLIRSVPPVIYEDLDGSQYEVKISSATKQVVQYEWFDGGPQMMWVVSLTLEQVA